MSPPENSRKHQKRPKQQQSSTLKRAKETLSMSFSEVPILETDLDYVMLTPQVTYYRSTDQDKLSREYLYFAFQSAPFQKQIKEEAGGGATRAYIGITKQLDLKLPIPAIGNQITLSKDARRIEACAKKALRDYEVKLQDLDDLRQSLLQKAFAGELT